MGNNLQERIEARRIEVIHLHGVCNVRGHTSRENGIASDAFLMKAPCDILGSADLFGRISHFADVREHTLSRLTRPCLLAVYAMPADAPETPALLATLTIDPLF